MEMQVPSKDHAKGGAAGSPARWSLYVGWLAPLLLLLVALLLITRPVASADVSQVDASTGEAMLARASLAASPPQTLTLTVSPTIIPASGLSFSTLTADVEDSLGAPVPDGTVVVFSTTLGTFPGGLTFTPQPTGVMTVEAESSAVVTVGTWFTDDDTSASGGEVIWSCTPSDHVTYGFTGTAISVIFQKQYNVGIARVHLDGEFVRDVDTYWDDGSGSGKLYQQEELIADGLPYVTHQISVEVTGISSPCAVVDAFRVYGHDRNGAYLTSGGLSTVNLTSIITPGTALVTACADPACDSAAVYFGLNRPQTLTLTANPTSIVADGVSTSTLTADVKDALGAPVPDGTVVVFSTTLGTFPGGLTFTPEPTGVMTVEAEVQTGEVVTTGNWVTYTESSASDGEVIYSCTVSDYVTYAFTGTAISVIFQKQFNAGIAHVYLDDSLLREVDTYWDDGSGSGKLYQQEELIAEGLPYAPHEVKVEATDLVISTCVVVDAFRVYGNDRNGAYLTSGGVATITLTSIITPGTALVTACSDSVCASTTVTFQLAVAPILYTYAPIVLRNFPAQPITGCFEAIQNGGFEDESAWVVGPTPRPARYTAEQVHGGSQSVLLGLKPGEGDVFTYSSVRQAIDLPSNTDSAALSFWYYPLSDLDAGDRQECLLLDQDDHVLSILMRTNINTADWIKGAYDIGAYAGQTVKVYCNAYNDGDGGGVAGFYLDDVSVQVCTGGAPPPEPPPPPPPPPPEPLDCYPKALTAVGVGQTPHGLAVNSTAKRVYVANHDDDTLSVFNSETYALVTTVPVGNGPNGVAYNPATSRIYVANRNGNSVTVLRASDYGVVKTITVGSQPNGLAVNEVTNRVYVANYGSGTVSIIDGASNTVTKTVAVGLEPAMVDVDPITNKAYVSLHGLGKVAVIDGGGNTAQVSIYSGGPYGIAVDALRHLVYVATLDTFRIAVVDGLSDSFLGWAEIRRLPSGQPVPMRMIAVNPLLSASGHIFVTTVGDDLGWDKFLLLPKGWYEYFGRAHALDLNAPQEGIAFEPTTLRVFVTSRTDDLVGVYQDGEPACPSNFAQLAGYQMTICVANPDGTCRETLIR